MKIHHILGALVLAACLGVSGCVPVNTVRPSNYNQHPVEYGTVTKAEMVRVKPRPVGVGTLIGGLLGGVLGHQFGGGAGKTAFTIVGAIGGAVAGNEVENAVSQDRLVVIVTIRTDYGVDLVAEQPADNQVLRLGDRVRIESGMITLVERPKTEK
ncbi:MAG: glycine zipper 2TM domain-containing protein [Betaproteobacteria bacterium]|nr:glycine zipper 2TM domain-containing protein [Betaproteobacteria bacterium]